MRVVDVRESARAFLLSCGVDEADLTADLILGEALGRDRYWIIANGDEVLLEDDERKLQALLKRRGSREPLAYIFGSQEFMGLKFEVDVRTLIPRADTECLVEEAMRHLSDGMELMDLCTGTGCVALSLLHYSNGTRAVATDISCDALCVAAKNARSLGLAERVELLEADLFPPVGRRFDIITANPPYIPSGDIDGLSPEVSAFEPRLALDGGADGLDFYRRIARGAREFLYSSGYLLVEIGFDQGERVAQLFANEGYREVEVVPELGGRDRVVKGWICVEGKHYV